MGEADAVSSSPHFINAMLYEGGQVEPNNGRLGNHKECSVDDVYTEPRFYITNRALRRFYSQLNIITMDLFTYLQDTFGILATESELNEIKFLVLGEERYIAESNGAKPLVSGALPPYDVELLKRLWVERNPQHEANSDTGEDMFWRTVFMVMADYMQLAGGNDR